MPQQGGPLASVQALDVVVPHLGLQDRTWQREIVGTRRFVCVDFAFQHSASRTVDLLFFCCNLFSGVSEVRVPL